MAHRPVLDFDVDDLALDGDRRSVVTGGDLVKVFNAMADRMLGLLVPRAVAAAGHCPPSSNCTQTQTASCGNGWRQRHRCCYCGCGGCCGSWTPWGPCFN